MLHQPAGASAKTGGGDEDEDGIADSEDAGDRVQPVKPVALWSGVLPVGADGKLTVPFAIPTYRGELRVMAFTASPTKIGRAEAKVTVRDPLVIQVTFPRFVTQNDKMEIPVFLTNMSGGPLDVSVQLASSDAAALQFGGKDAGTLHLDDGRADTLVFQTTAKLPVGAAKLRVVAKATGRKGTFEVSDEVDVPFLPAGPSERVVQKIKLVPGKLDLEAQPALKSWVPTSEKTTFWMTSNPYGEAFDHLEYLIHYPYGCIEQTTSATRPLLYIANLVEQVDPELAQMKIEDMVLAGINRVLSMETPSGGFGYWPGSDHPEDWGTAYATHMLLDAKKAGYAVPEDRLQGVLAWIEGRVAELDAKPWQSQRSYWQQEQGETYLHYVLALAGKGRKARILKLIERLPKDAKQEQAEDLYMLKAALYLAGDRRYAAELKHPDTSPIQNDRNNSWSFYSDRRRRGMVLSTFFDLFGADPAGELLATRVAEGITGQRSYWYTTQELVWGVTGLGKWVNATSKGIATGTLTADGATVDARKTKKPTNDKTWSIARASEKKSLVLDVPESAAGMYLVISSQGVRAGADYKVGGNGLAVGRTYRDLAGDVIDLSQGTVKLGDVIYVEDEISNTSGAMIQNIALVDRLPAGFEIENPRLGRGFKADWINPDDDWATDYFNLRDDRVEAFGSLAGRSSAKLIYTISAVTSGTYATPPIEAEAMYDPTLWAREKGSTAVVGGPWTGKLL
jgi:uncharacterized protein YfaS (alpha-2-macroglobulin family)